jgi:hypothetical protein
MAQAKSERPIRGMEMRPEEPLLLFVFVGMLSDSSPETREQ